MIAFNKKVFFLSLALISVQQAHAADSSRAAGKYAFQVDLSRSTWQTSSKKEKLGYFLGNFAQGLVTGSFLKPTDRDHIYIIAEAVLPYYAAYKKMSMDRTITQRVNTFAINRVLHFGVGEVFGIPSQEPHLLLTDAQSLFASHALSSLTKICIPQKHRTLRQEEPSLFTIPTPPFFGFEEPLSIRTSDCVWGLGIIAGAYFFNSRMNEFFDRNAYRVQLKDLKRFQASIQKVTTQS